MRVSENKINKTLKKEIINTLAQLITDINTGKEAMMFLEDFFNETELETYAKRLAVAYWLKKKRSYSNIKQNLKVSSATISTISEIIHSKGFELAIKKIEAEEWASVWIDKIKKINSKITK